MCGDWTDLRRQIADERVEPARIRIASRACAVGQHHMGGLDRAPHTPRRSERPGQAGTLLDIPRLRRAGCCLVGSHPVPAELEPREVRLHLDALLLDRRAVRVHADRQHAAARKRAEQDRIRLGAVFARQRERVERHEAPGERARRAEDVVRRVHAARRAHALVDRVEPVRRRDDRRALRRREAELDRAPDLEKLGRQEHVERAGHGIERERRRVIRLAGVDLDVVRRRSGPLRDAGDRGPVADEPGGMRGLDDPFREHAATLPPDRGDQQREEPALAHSTASARRRMTDRRTRPRNRSQRDGFATTRVS